MEALETLTRLIENDPIAAGVLVILLIQWWRSRDSERDDQNTSNAIALASAVVTTFEPLRILLERMVDRVDSTQQEIQTLVTAKHEETQTVISGAARENRLSHQTMIEKWDRAETVMVTGANKRDRQYEETIARIDRLHTEFKALTEAVRVIDVPEAIRGSINQLVLITTEIASNVKRLLPPEPPEPFTKIEGGAKKPTDDLPLAAGE